MRAHAKSDWVATLPSVLLGLRCALKDTNVSAARLVCGSPLRLPGEFFTDDSTPRDRWWYFCITFKTKNLNWSDQGSQVHEKNICFAGATKGISHVFVRHDAVREPITNAIWWTVNTVRITTLLHVGDLFCHNIHNNRSGLRNSFPRRRPQDCSVLLRTKVISDCDRWGFFL